MLQIANITAIALVMVTTGCNRETAERAMSQHFFWCNAQSMLIAHGCKLHVHVSARGDVSYTVHGYAHDGADVTKALAEADRKVLDMRTAERLRAAESIGEVIAIADECLAEARAADDRAALLLDIGRRGAACAKSIADACAFDAAEARRA